MELQINQLTLTLKKFCVDFVHRRLFDEYLSNFGIVQLIDFVIWPRLAENSLRTSVHDHVYTTDCTFIDNG